MSVGGDQDHLPEDVRRRRDEWNKRKVKQRALLDRGLRRETLVLRDDEIAIAVPGKALIDQLISSGKLKESEADKPAAVARAVRKFFCHA